MCFFRKKKKNNVVQTVKSDEKAVNPEKKDVLKKEHPVKPEDVKKEKVVVPEVPEDDVFVELDIYEDDDEEDIDYSLHQDAEIIVVDHEDTDEELQRLESCGLHSYHITKIRGGDYDNKWRVRRSCTDSTIAHFHTQLEAINFAKQLSKETKISITIHKVSGKIRKQHYGEHKHTHKH